VTNRDFKSADRLQGIDPLRAILRGDPVARRLTLGIILFSTLVAIITTSIQLYFDYRFDVAGIQRRFDEIRHAEVPFLVNSVWVLDPIQIQTQLDGLARLQDIESLIVSIDGQPRWSSGTATSTSRLTTNIPLVYRYRDTDLTIGQLQVIASLDNVRARIFNKLLVVLLSNGVKTFLVGIFALFLFHSLVTRHVARAARYLRQQNLLAPTVGDLALERRQNSTAADFLDELVAAINDLRLNLLRNLQRLSSLFEVSPIGIVLAAGDGRILDGNPALLRMLGYSLDELKRKNLRDLAPPQHNSADIQEADHLLGMARHEPVEKAFVGKNGALMLARLNGAAFLGSDGETLLWLMVEDIGERRRIEKALLESERRLNSFFVESPVGMSIIDHEGRWTRVNPKVARTFGSTPDAFIGRRPRDVFSPEFAAKLEADIDRILSTGKSEINVEMSGASLADPGRIRHYLGSRFPLAVSEGLVAEIGSVIVDITALKEAEECLRQSQKIDAIGQLTGGVAHDFNNILTVITGTIEILADAVADRPNLAAITRMIDDAATRGAKLTQQLLAFSRKQPLQPRSVDVNVLIVDAANLLKPTLGEDIEIEAMLEGSPWFAIADPSQLSTALINLAINARDAMPDGGKLTFESGNVVLDEAYAQANPDTVPGLYVMIAVSDTGTGIPAAIRDRVFEPFFTTKEIGKGTGLGLSMVYGFVTQSRGHIKIYSEEGHGTTIRLYLPHVTDQPLDAVAESRTFPGGHETILMVEDDELVRNYVLVQLGSLGYPTLSASNAAEALAIVDSGARFDLLFTDVILTGGLNGRRLADEVKKRRPGMRVLFTSGYTENAIVHHGRLDADVILLAKPYRKADLARKIREVLA
jgi:PAS domain S-box-containing protein